MNLNCYKSHGIKSCNLKATFVGALILASSFLTAQTPLPQSASFSSDTTFINKNIKEATNYFQQGLLEKAETLTKEAESRSKKTGYKKGVVLAMNLNSRILYRRGDYDNSITLSTAALKMGKELNDSVLQSSSLISLANVHSLLGNNTTALEYYFKGLSIEEKIKEQNNLQWYFSNIGNLFSNQKNYKKALEYTLKSKDLVEKRKDKRFLNIIYNNIGWIYLLLDNYDSSYYALNKSLKLSEAAGDKYGTSLCLDNLSQLYIKLKKYDEAYAYSLRSYNISKQQGLKEQTISCLIAMGTINLQSNKLTASETDLKKALKLASEIKLNLLARDAALQLALLFNKKSDYETAYNYYKTYAELKDSLLNEENSKLLTEMNTKYTTEKKEKEIELLKKNEDIQKLELIHQKNKLERQRTVSIGVFVGFLLLMIVAILFYSRYRLKKKANDQLQDAFNLIEEKNAVIEKSNVLITDSITYAKRIQDAILPAQEDLTAIFSTDFFILYKPSQIVSGDFYWCSSHENKTILVVADCTGHGVPGAFMSMIGNTLLNEIVNERKITCTKKIASLLNEKIVHALRQYDGSQKHDGMDISICSIDKTTKEINFTGANHFMYAFNGKLHKIKGDSFSIGGAHQQGSRVFASQQINYEPGLCLYFLTDGYCDQSCETTRKRFSSKQLENLLVEIRNLDMTEQKERLEKAFEEWKGNSKQRDDVLVVGIKCT